LEIIDRSHPLLTDEQTTLLQFSIDANNLVEAQELLEHGSPEELTEMQFYLNSTALMYALQRGTPEMVRLLLEKGTGPFELPYSDNNELKSAVRNQNYAAEMVKLLLESLPRKLLNEMIVSDWDPEGEGVQGLQSPLELARSNSQVKKLLTDALES
jgi:ankyrin repeat protein